MGVVIHVLPSGLEVADNPENREIIRQWLRSCDMPDHDRNVALIWARNDLLELIFAEHK